MIKISITNSQTNETREFIQEPFTTMRTRLTPYVDECFAIDTETVICGLDLGVAVCKVKTGEVLYRNSALASDVPLKHLTCVKTIY